MRENASLITARKHVIAKPAHQVRPRVKNRRLSVFQSTKDAADMLNSLSLTGSKATDGADNHLSHAVSGKFFRNQSSLR